VQFFSIFFIWYSIIGQSRAEPKKMVLLELLMNPDATEVRMMIEDEVRAAIFTYTSPAEIEVLSRKNVRTRLEGYAKPFRCLNDSCIRDVITTTKSEYVIFGSLQKEKEWVLELSMYARDEGQIVATFTDQAPTEIELLQKTKKNVLGLLQSLPIALDLKHQGLKMSPEPSGDNQEASPKETKIKVDHQDVRFHVLAFQCAKNRSGLNLLGYCHEGIFLGPVHIGAGVYSKVDRIFLGGIQASIYNHTSSFFGGLQIGVVNETENLHGGIQASIVNTSNEVLGLQLGIVNISNKIYGSQFGVVNETKDLVGMHVGLINTAKRVYGLQVGFINTTGALYGVQLGFLNFSSRNAIPMAVGVNIGW
jgi:hypothetical protein